MREAYIIGVGMTPFGKWLDKTVKSLTSKAVENALRDCALETKDLQAAWFSNSTWGYFSGQDCIRGQLALRPIGLSGIPITNLENACAGASTALHSAWIGVGSGLYECALAVGAEKMYSEDRKKMFDAFYTCIDAEGAEAHFEQWAQVTRSTRLRIPEAAPDGSKEKSSFMDIYAAMSHWHMDRFGSTQEQMALISAKNHFHGSLNPNAQIRKEMTLEEVLAARTISWPLTLPMCAPIGDGAAAAVICSKDFLKRISDARPVKILASVLLSGTDRGLDEEDVSTRGARLAYEKAGLGPGDIHTAECHDATAYGELRQAEAMGFCPMGDGGAWAESGATRLGGLQPLNPSGGLECRGHPVGASGLAQIFELVTQLRGEAGKRQVDGAKLALAENGGGNIGYEEAALSIHILERAF